MRALLDKLDAWVASIAPLYRGASMICYAPALSSTYTVTTDGIVYWSPATNLITWAPGVGIHPDKWLRASFQLPWAETGGLRFTNLDVSFSSDAALPKASTILDILPPLETFVITDPPAASAAPSSAPNVAAYEDVGRWLDLATHELDVVTGVSRRSYFYWKQTLATPRPNTVRQLWKVHALLQTIVRSLGEGGARTWLRAGNPSPLDLLLAADIARFQRIATARLFRESPSRRRTHLRFRSTNGTRPMTTFRAGRPVTTREPVAAYGGCDGGDRFRHPAPVA